MKFIRLSSHLRTCIFVQQLPIDTWGLCDFHSARQQSKTLPVLARTRYVRFFNSSKNDSDPSTCISIHGYNKMDLGRGGSVVQRRTPERVVWDSKPTSAVLCH